MLGLGDKSYSDFCGASKKFDLRLEALGAKRLAPRGECDVDYEAAAKTWVDGLWDKLGSSAGQASRLSPSDEPEDLEAGATPVLRASHALTKLNPATRTSAALISEPSLPRCSGSSPSKSVPRPTIASDPSSVIAEMAAEANPTASGGNARAASHQ